MKQSINGVICTLKSKSDRVCTIWGCPLLVLFTDAEVLRKRTLNIYFESLNWHTISRGNKILNAHTFNKRNGASGSLALEKQP